MATRFPETKAALRRLKTSWLGLRAVNAELRMVNAQNEYMKRALAFADHDKMAAADDVAKCVLLIAMIEARADMQQGVNT